MTHFSDLPQPFGRREAIAAGFGTRRMERAADAGQLVRLAQGLYAVSAPWLSLPPWTRHEHLARAAVRLTPDAIVSHSSAAVLLGLPHPAYARNQVTMTLLDDSRTSRKDTWRQFHRGSTPPEHILIVGGHPYLTPTRTVIDCARELHPRDALAVMDAALRAGLVTTRTLIHMRRHQHGWPGITDADRLMAITNPLRENWFESISAWALHSRDLPAGIPQVTVVDESGRAVARVDALWPELGVVGEADGLGKYALGADGLPADDALVAAQASVHAERRRENRLRDVGLEVFRWEPADALAITPVVDRFLAARERADPTRVRARYRCHCCRQPLAHCPRTTGSHPLSA